MARVIPSPAGIDPQDPFELELLETLRSALGDGFVLLPNFQLKQRGRQNLEYDLVVLAPYAMFVLEAKRWYGQVTGDDHEWLLNQKARRCPLPLVDLKCKVLKSALGAVGREVWVEPLLVVPDATRVEIDGNWADHVCGLGEVEARIRNQDRLQYATDLRGYHEAILKSLLGSWLARDRSKRRRIGAYEIVEILADDGETVEYLARRVIGGGRARYRIRVWPLDPTRPPEAMAKQRAVICRPAEALDRVGPHPNLLPIQHFDFDEDHSEYYEVSEWSDFGTLHGYLEHQARDQLTLRERLEIAAGVAAALEAVHGVDLVHRNLCPETILIDFERRPRLTDFDRAYIEKEQTVFAETEKRRKNPAYVPPELADATDYDFTTSSDMYAFGVLLYRLLTDRVPFRDAAEARARDGRAEPPSALRDGLGPELDELVRGLLRVDDFNQRPAASAALELLRATLRGSATPSQPTVTTPAELPTSLSDGTILDDKYRIDAQLGSGGFSQVYRVYHLDQQRTLAMKLLRKCESDDSLVREFQHSLRLPEHPNIARTVWMDRLPPPDQRVYLLSEFIDGEPLTPWCDGRKRLSLSDVREIALKLLDALDAFHPKTARLAKLRAKNDKKTLSEAEYEEFMRLREQAGEGILHRDLKPDNILLELPSHEPKIIDFNIASQLREATGRGGTPRYWAPDRGLPEWRPDMDLFSLGVVLYELVTHRHPFPDQNPEQGKPYDPREICTDPRISDALADFLLKAVQPAGAERFQSAAEMAAALRAIDNLHAPAANTEPEPGTHPGLELLPEERGRSDYNPYVTRLLTLYSQARRTNAGTRGLDDIARRTYVRTRLDQQLAPAILDGRFRLVIITGNAGDGKTAFLHRLEDLFAENGAEVDRLPSGNGSRWIHDGLSYETNYDGSQDEGDKANDAVLERFFAPFAGAALAGLEGDQVRLVAINEGRLLDFLRHGAERERFGGLREFVDRAQQDGTGTDSRALLVNLNLRAVTAGGGRSLVAQQLAELLKDELWAPCGQCQLRQRCPLKHNADTLLDPASGAAVRERIHRLFEVLHLRRRAHVTMRDLRSALAWLLLRDHGCAEVAEMLAGGGPEVGERLVALSYSEAFADQPAPRTTVEDRLVRLLREVDVGRVDDPQLDRRLDYDPTSAVPWMTFESRSAYMQEVLEALGENVPRSVEEAELVTLLAQRRLHLARWRRRAYFERRDEGWQRMLPYRALADLEALVVTEAEPKQCQELQDTVIRAVSVSEGLRSEAVHRGHLALRVSRVREPSVRSYRLFPKDDFRLEVSGSATVAPYLETAPDAVELVYAREDGRARLRISLDLLEMLELIGRGYRPSPADLRGLFVNLQIFRNELLNLPFRQIVVTRDDQEFYDVSATTGEDGHIGLLLRPRSTQIDEGVPA